MRRFAILALAALLLAALRPALGEPICSGLNCGHFGSSRGGPPIPPCITNFNALVKVDVADGEFELAAAGTNNCGTDFSGPVEIGVGAYITPPLTLQQDKKGNWRFIGTVADTNAQGAAIEVKLDVTLTPLDDAGDFELRARAKGADLTETTNPVSITVSIGDESSFGATSVPARLD